MADIFHAFYMCLTLHVTVYLLNYSGISKNLSSLHGAPVDKTLDLKGKNILSSRFVNYQLCKYSEELRELSALNLLPTNDQDP